MKYYPIAVSLHKKKVVVIGGGKVAERKVRSLREAGANVCVISPEVTSELRHLTEQEEIEYQAVRQLSEQNPMLGFRGCRIGVIYPEITRIIP